MHACTRSAATGLCVAVLSLLSLLSTANDARACGACVSPQPPPGSSEYPVLQNAERVLFYIDKDKNTVAWVEVRYQGLAENFGWILPLPKVPEVTVGTEVVFNRLDDATAKRFVLKRKYPDENCRDPNEGCDPTSWGTSSGSSGGPPSGGFADSGGVAVDAATGGGGAPEGVQVLDHGTTGPYDYVTVKGSDAKVLTDWLNKNQFVTPGGATAILESHIQKGDVFLAIKLTNGAGVEQIKPVVLKMKDAEPCVPLRLTSVAAVPDMSVVVTVVGPGRAVVKNHLDVVPNPLKVNLFKQGNNYPQVLSEAIDEVGGHAFVTEYSQPSTALGAQLKSGLSTGAFASADTLRKFAFELYGGGKVWLFPDAAEAIDEQAKLADLIPYKSASAVDALGWLWSCASVWTMGGSSCTYKGVTMTAEQAQSTPFPGAKVHAALKAAIIDPVYHVADALEASGHIATRLVLRIDPQEMDRDPVFAFHADNQLGHVDSVYVADYRRVCTDGWSSGHKAVRIIYPGLGSWLFDGEVGVGTNVLQEPAKSAPWAWKATLQGETGKATLIDPSQYDAVDAAIAAALPGKPSLPADFKLKTALEWAPPSSDDAVTTVGPWCPPNSYCVPKAGWAPGKVPPTYPGAGTGPGASICTFKGADGGGGSSSSGGEDASGSSGSGSSSGSASSSSSGSSGGSAADLDVIDDGQTAVSSSGGGSNAAGGAKKDGGGCTVEKVGAGGPSWLLMLLVFAAVPWTRRRRRC